MTRISIIHSLVTLGLMVSGAVVAHEDTTQGRIDPDPHAPVFAAPAVPAGAQLAPEAWDRQDPADSIYRAARQAMNDGRHERAAQLFQRIWTRYSGSSYAPDAPYWEAFNRYRVGGTRQLEQALVALETQRERWPEAATRRNGDAVSLNARIRGLLARQGDEASATALVAAANEMAETVLRGINLETGEIDGELEAELEALSMVLSEEGQRLGMEMARVAEQAATSAVAGMRLGMSGTHDIPEHCRDETEVQLAALNGLVHMNPDRALPVLRQIMERRDECAPVLRRRAIFLIADMESPESVDLLLEAARTDPDVEVRRQAVFWLSEVDDPRAIRALEQVLRQADDEQIRERAVFALSQHDDPRARQLLRNVAQDRSMSTELRGRALFWLGTEGGDDDLDFLKDMFGRVGDAELQEKVLMAVAQAERRQDVDWLLSIAGDEQVQRDLRAKAVFWAAEAGAPAAALGSLYDRVQDRELKEKVLFGLSESEQPEAIDRLIRIARTERDPELRKRAVFWLANSNDPRAEDVLMELLAGPPPR